MKYVQLFFAGIILLLTISSCGRPIEPLDLAKKIFGSDNLSDIKKYTTNQQMILVAKNHGWPYRQIFSKYVTQKFLLLEQTDKRAIVLMTILDSAGKGFDACIYFQRDATWRMNSYHTFYPDYNLKINNALLKQMSSFQVDSIIEKCNDQKQVLQHGLCLSSREDYEFQLGATRLLLSMDDTLMNHFLKHKNDFEQVKDIVLAGLDSSQINYDNEIKLPPHIQNEYRKIFISAVSMDKKKYGNSLLFLLDARPLKPCFVVAYPMDFTGYLYVKDKKQLPEMNPRNIYMLREIGDGWYLYKRHQERVNWGY